LLAKQFGSLVKDRRVKKGMRQEDLARAAKVSRTVLSRLEHGNASVVQTDILDRLFLALQMSPSIVDCAAPDEARKQARRKQQEKLELQRSRHLRLAIDLASDARAAAKMVAEARDRVELWRRTGSCSPYYIERWSKLLGLAPRKMAKQMASLGEWEDALFQNSPWSWAWS